MKPLSLSHNKKNLLLYPRGDNMNANSLNSYNSKKIYQYLIGALVIGITIYFAFSFFGKDPIVCYIKQRDGLPPLCYTAHKRSRVVVNPNVPCDATCIPESAS
jgi:hypothetical protein